MAQFFYPDTKLIKPNYSEVARYLGYRKIDTPEEQVNELIKVCSEKMHGVLQPRGVYEIFDLELMTESENLSANGDRVNCPTNSIKMSRIKFADVDFYSVDLGRNLADCKKVALFAATLGPLVDAMIRKAELTSPVEAAVFQATGAMYIEEVVELLNQKLNEEAGNLGLSTKPRYSPGYGDVPLTMQRDFFRLLPCTRIGLSLMDTLIMAPEKSVTAFVGMY